MIMKYHPTPKQRVSGFTLVELLLAVLIMLILAGITIAALGPIQRGAAARATEAFIAELETGLTRYEIDFGWYPLSPENGVSSQDFGTRDQEGRLGSGILYKELSGDFNGDGEPDSDVDTYVKNLVGNPAKTVEAPTGGGFWILDSFNGPIRYLADQKTIDDRQTFNPTFDVWSIAGTDPTETSEETTRRKYVTNFGFK